MQLHTNDDTTQAVPRQNRNSKLPARRQDNDKRKIDEPD
jgi:hypothetical protein